MYSTFARRNQCISVIKNGVRFTKLTIGIVVEILLLIHYMMLNGQSRVKIMLF